MKDEEIVELFRERSEKAVEKTQTKYGKYCLYIARNILGNDEDAEECVNEALLAAWNSIPPNKPENLKTYVGRLTRNVSISRWRMIRSEKRCPSEFSVSLEEIEEIAVDDDFDAKADEKILSKAISDFLRSIPEDERNIMIRRYWFNDPLKSICDRYGFGESKVKVTLKRSREKLAKYLKKEGLII